MASCLCRWPACTPHITCTKLKFSQAPLFSSSLPLPQFCLPYFCSSHATCDIIPFTSRSLPYSQSPENMNSLRERLWSLHLIYLVIIVILPFSSQGTLVCPLGSLRCRQKQLIISYSCICHYRGPDTLSYLKTVIKIRTYCTANPYYYTSQIHRQRHFT